MSVSLTPIERGLTITPTDNWACPNPTLSFERASFLHAVIENKLLRQMDRRSPRQRRPIQILPALHHPLPLNLFEGISKMLAELRLHLPQ
jgi:hypothetical protein